MKISIVIPCYNEEGNIFILEERIAKVLQNISYEILFVDDGSTDKTLFNIKKLKKQKNNINYISFTRNFGHQYALKAGIDHSYGDCTVSMDADLQHPPELIPELIKKWQEGYDIVYTQRIENKKNSFFKKHTSKFFYKIINYLSDTKIEERTADFRLTSKKATEVIRGINETNIFFRGLVPWTGFKQHKIQYRVEERYSGKSKYSVTKMFSFAVSGITSFSVVPLRISVFLGLIISILAFIYGIFALMTYFFTDKTITGWTSVLASTMFISGIQLLMLGIIGEYLGKLFIGSKNRPLYIINEKSISEEK